MLRQAGALYIPAIAVFYRILPIETNKRLHAMKMAMTAFDERISKYYHQPNDEFDTLVLCLFLPTP